MAFAQAVLNAEIFFLGELQLLAKGQEENRLFHLNLSKSLNRSQGTLPLPPRNIRKQYSFVMFSGGRERVRWKKMG